MVVDTPGLHNVRPSGATPGLNQNAVGDPNDPLTQHDSGIYILVQNRDGAKMIALERTAYQGAKIGGILTSAMTYGIAKMKVKAVIPGKKASLRISDASPVFYFYFDDKAASLGASSFGAQNISNPNQFALIRLNVDKASRSTEIVSFSMWGGSSGSNEKAIVGYKSERLRPGLYKITLNEAMKAGEYCFVAASGVAAATTPYAAGAATAHELFDFGRDSQAVRLSQNCIAQPHYLLHSMHGSFRYPGSSHPAHSLR